MNTTAGVTDSKETLKRRKRKSLVRDLKRAKSLYIMLIPVLIWYIIFFYKPIGALQIAFKDYNPLMGVAGSKWVGLKHFQKFFSSPYVMRIIRNSFTINLIQLVTVFPLTVIFALFINEIPLKKYKTFVQTASYLPHFISSVVVAGLVVAKVQLLKFLPMTIINFM